jgi:hypothetical protein
LQVEFKISGFSDSANFTPNATAILELAMRDMECPKGLIRRCIVADAEHFGAAVAALHPGAGYTNNEAHVAVGKMLRLPDESGAPVFGLVLRDFIFAGAAAALAKRFEDRSGVEQRMIYVIWHEVAHVADAMNRPDHLDSGASSLRGIFKISRIGGYYAEIAMDEATICWLSARIVSQSMLELEIDETNDNILRQLHRLRRETATYSGNLDHLGRIAWMAAQVFWMILVQHGKVFAFISGNDQLPAMIWLWPSAATGARELIAEYGSLLTPVFAVYPETRAEFERRAIPLWRRIAELHGFSFPENPNGGDGVFWNEIWMNLELGPEPPG